MLEKPNDNHFEDREDHGSNKNKLLDSNSYSLTPPSNYRELGVILSIEKSIIHLKKLQELFELIVTSGRKLIPYKFAFVFTVKGKCSDIHSYYGTTEGHDVEERDYYSSCDTIIRECLELYKCRPEIKCFKSEDVGIKLNQMNSKYLSGNIYWSPLITMNKRMIGGVVYVCDTPLNDNELRILRRLRYSYCNGLLGFIGRRTKLQRLVAKLSSFKVVTAVLLVLLTVLVIPVSTTITVDSEVVVDRAWVATIPADGTLSKVYVEQGQIVAKDDPLFSLDDTDLKAKRDRLLNELEKVKNSSRKKQKLNKNQVDANNTENVISDFKIEHLKAEIAATEKSIDNYFVKANRGGIILFKDNNIANNKTKAEYLNGKRVTIGEELAVVADQEEPMVKAGIMANKKFDIYDASKLVFYSNNEDSSSTEVELKYISFEPVEIKPGVLGYFIYANFKNRHETPVIGTMGKLKIYGDRLPLIYKFIK